MPNDELDMGSSIVGPCRSYEGEFFCDLFAGADEGEEGRFRNGAGSGELRREPVADGKNPRLNGLRGLFAMVGGHAIHDGLIEPQLLQKRLACRRVGDSPFLGQPLPDVMKEPDGLGAINVKPHLSRQQPHQIGDLHGMGKDVLSARRAKGKRPKGAENIGRKRLGGEAGARCFRALFFDLPRVVLLARFPCLSDDDRGDPLFGDQLLNGPLRKKPLSSVMGAHKDARRVFFDDEGDLKELFEGLDVSSILPDDFWNGRVVGQRDWREKRVFCESLRLAFKG